MSQVYVEDITEEVEHRRGEYSGEWYSLVDGMTFYRIELNDNDPIVYDENGNEVNEETTARIIKLLEENL